MHAYEAIWGALLDGVTCGRPQGHNGRCRSVQAVLRSKERSRKGWAEEQARVAKMRDEHIRKMRDDRIRGELFAAVEAVSKAAEAREMAKRAVNW